RSGNAQVTMIAGLVGAALVLLSGIVNWIRIFVRKGFDIPAKVLFAYRTSGRGGFSIGLVLLLVAIVCAIGAVIPGLDIVRRVGGFAAVAIALLFCVQLARFVSGTDTSFFSLI